MIIPDALQNAKRMPAAMRICRTEEFMLHNFVFEMFMCRCCLRLIYAHIFASTSLSNGIIDFVTTNDDNAFDQ